MKKAIMGILAILILCGMTSAKYTQTSKVKYKTNYGWSDYYTVEVTFVSGTELNRATRSLDYDGFSTYAVVFWDKGQASVIKISSYTGCGLEVTQRCITNKITNLVGDDQHGRGWEVCTNRICY